MFWVFLYFIIFYKNIGQTTRCLLISWAVEAIARVIQESLNFWLDSEDEELDGLRFFVYLLTDFNFQFYFWRMLVMTESYILNFSDRTDEESKAEIRNLSTLKWTFLILYICRYLSDILKEIFLPENGAIEVFGMTQHKFYEGYSIYTFTFSWLLLIITVYSLMVVFLKWFRI